MIDAGLLLPAAADTACNIGNMKKLEDCMQCCLTTLIWDVIM